jgi:hypothetical protein
MTACRQSPPEAMLADTLSAKTCCQRCSTATSGDHPGQRRWVCVSKNRPRACLTTFRRRVHSRPVLGDHLQLSHGRGWCLTTGGRRAMLAGVLDSVVSRKCSAGDAGWWRVVEYIVRLPARKKNHTLYSDGRQDYTPGIRSMSGRKFLINPQQDTCSGYYAGKNS